MKSQKELKKVWECLETFPTPEERTKRRWVLKSRKEKIKNMKDLQIDTEYNLRYEIWK
tara:strand:- start:152 stop:325 length:174 start_codon:yes stop_codon:yes gene_type:complete